MERIKQVVDTKTGEVVHQEMIPGNDNFVMMFRDKMPAIRTLMKADPMAARVLFVIIEEMARDNVLATSQKTLSEYAGCSVASVCRAYKTLKKHGIIETYFVGNLPCIAVNPELVWTSHANGKKYAKCKATLLISADEQKSPRGKRIKTITTDVKKDNPLQERIFPQETVQAEATRV